MEQKINTFIFDCFGVICNPPISNWYKENMVNRGFVNHNFLNTLKDFDLGNLSEKDLYKCFSKYEGIISNEKEIQEQVDSHLGIDSKLINIILKLKNKGFKIVLLSNGHNSFFERKIYKTYPEFKSLFDKIIISSNLKIVKPDSKIYIHTLKEINSTPEESLLIDDNKTNINGALNVGIQGFLYTDSDSFIEYINNLGINLNN
jgi:putative hydrolase of the HAD superfamily